MSQRVPYRNTEPGVKWCPQCETNLPYTAFGFAAHRHDKLSGWCKECRRTSSAVRRKVLSRERRIVDACWNYLGTRDPEKVAAHLRRYLESGLSVVRG